ncbi:hypothetical protein GCM10027176_03410 [Actinoallomurus bryophytorum]|uniref:Pentapeptide repeat protein n=1 Tax=Actinoallomurus bryophytorum TaxID=1490222 RepID=A0A543CJV9_9ACTN|nr:pentapeptide repeat-containing protein [Actinoallomurus bryophytorum]TQL97386.1 pentapeptide repeat protein [Actinoallomurus bryophytorum]
MSTAPEPGTASGDSSAGVRITEPTQEELDALPPDRRLELLHRERQRDADERERRRQSRHQWFNSVGILFGVLFTAAGLVATALTWRTGQGELRTAREGQITDRYTKATEQLGSPGRDVRTGAIYALERIAGDSPRDRLTIVDVLAAFVREHDPAASVPAAKLPTEPDTDVLAALTVLGRIPHSHHFTDLHATRIPGSQIPTADLSGMNLFAANLSHGDLINAKLRYTNLTHVNLTRADLDSANLTGASLRGADLTGANLKGTNLSDADLAGVRGMTPAAIRAVARTDALTKF